MVGFDNSRLTECPTLRPSASEFQDPIGYLSRRDIKQLGYKYGIVKVVPPEGWQPPFLLSLLFKFHTRLQKLSDLGITTRSRKCFIENLNRFLKMKKKPGLHPYFVVNNGASKVWYYDLFVQVDKLGGFSNVLWEDWQSLNVFFNINKHSQVLQQEYDQNIKAYAEFLGMNNSNEFPESDSEDESGNCLVCGKRDSPTKTLLCDNCDNPYHLRCVGLEKVPVSSWYCKKCLIGTGEYGFEEQVDLKYSLPEFFNHCLEFQEDFCAKYGKLSLDQIEKKFWEFVELEKSDLEVRYGADIHNLKPGEISGFPMHSAPDSIKTSFDKQQYDKYANDAFNLTNLPYSKGSLLNFVNHAISGMTIPWIYVGSLLSTFCWHVEDHYTLSANYCHFGSTKKWYGIPASDAEKFEKLMKDTAPDLFKKQPDLLHQLVTLISPMKLIENGINCYYANQNPREFVITYPKVYHAGFNSGFNFNEAVNFTMDFWLEYGEKAIVEYRRIQKENVFNHYKLIENILINYSVNQEHNISLVERCLRSYKKFAANTQHKLEQLSHDFEVKQLDQGINYSSYMENKLQTQDEEDEEELCDMCKTHISHVYCVLNNRDHNFSSRNLEEHLNQKRISINQLLTPEASPLERPNDRFESVKTQENGALKASQALYELTNDKAKLDQLKQGMESGESRRKSSRIEKLKHQLPVQSKSKMSVINHNDNINDLNRKRVINLCLDCGSTIKLVPYKSKLIVKVSVEEMNKFIDSIEARLNIIDLTED